MQIDLSGKVAIVTGSTKGIGLGAVKGLAESGAAVVLNGRTQEAVDTAIAEVKKAVPGADVTGVAADLGSAGGCEILTKAVPACDILVHNLGIYGAQDFFETPDDVWQKFFDVNIMASVRLSRFHAPAMVGKKWGRIVFIASESAFNIPDEMIHYGFTKAGMVAIARGLAKRLAGTGVNVNSVLPGSTMSDGAIAMFKPQAEKEGKTIWEVGAEYLEKKRPGVIIQRIATVEEVANMIVYACSKEASATTGASLRVEGGLINVP